MNQAFENPHKRGVESECLLIVMCFEREPKLKGRTAFSWGSVSDSS